MVRATDQLLLPLEIIFCPGVRKPLRCVSVRSPVPFHSSSIDLSIRRSFVRRPTIPFELSSTKRDNYFPEREESRRSSLCTEKIKRQFRGSSPQNACARSFNKREIYLRSDGPYPWIPWTGSLFQRRCCWLYCRHLGQRRSRHCSELGRMNVLVSVNAPSATFRESTSPFSFEIFLLTTIPSYFWPRHCLRAAPLVFLPSSVEEKRNRSNTNRERHSALVSMNYHLAWSIVTPNGLYYFDLLGLLNRRFRVGGYLLWVFAIFFFVDNSDLLSLLLLALLDSFSLPFLLDK